MNLSKIQKNELLKRFKHKLLKKEEITKQIYDVVQDKDEIEKIFNSIRRQNKIQYIFQTYYYILSEEEHLTNTLIYSNFELIAAVLNKLRVKWYFGLGTANDLNKVVWQPSKIMYIINNKYVKTITLRNQKIKFIKLKKEKIIEFNQNKSKNRIKLNTSSIEKTYMDYQYIGKKIPSELRNKINIEKVEQIRKELKRGTI